MRAQREAPCLTIFGRLLDRAPVPTFTSYFHDQTRSEQKELKIENNNN